MTIFLPILLFWQLGNHAPMPNPKLTPGATLHVSKEQVCTPGYATITRNVSESVKKRVFAEYGIQITPDIGERFEVDHLVSLELSGSNDIKNLWPQPYTGPWNAHIKDSLEARLHAFVCAGKVSLPEAQHDISTDWVSAYKKYFSTSFNRPKR